MMRYHLNVWSKVIPALFGPEGLVPCQAVLRGSNDSSPDLGEF